MLIPENVPVPENTLAPKNSQSGFSLVEAMIALMILAVGLLGLAELQITAMKSNSKSGSFMELTVIAQTAIEEVMAISLETDALYTSVLMVDGAGFSWPTGTSVATLPNIDKYEVTYTSVPDIGGAGSQLIRVTVRVASTMGGVSAPPVEMTALKDLRKII